MTAPTVTGAPSGVPPAASKEHARMDTAQDRPATPPGGDALPALNALELLALAFHRVVPRTESTTATPVHPSWES